jgi:hypothetical protein
VKVRRKVDFDLRELSDGVAATILRQLNSRGRVKNSLADSVEEAVELDMSNRRRGGPYPPRPFWVETDFETWEDVEGAAGMLALDMERVVEEQIAAPRGSSREYELATFVRFLYAIITALKSLHSSYAAN